MEEVCRYTYFEVELSPHTNGKERFMAARLGSSVDWGSRLVLGVDNVTVSDALGG